MTEDWRDCSLVTVLYEYTVKNASVPSDIGALIAYLLLFLATWYVLIWTVRALIWLVWPVLLVACALFLYRFLRTFEPEELADLIFKILSVMADTALAAIAKVLEYLLSFLN